VHATLSNSVLRQATGQNRVRESVFTLNSHSQTKSGVYWLTKFMTDSQTVHINRERHDPAGSTIKVDELEREVCELLEFAPRSQRSERPRVARENSSLDIEPVVVWIVRILRRHSIRIVMGGLFGAVAYVILSIHAVDQLEAEIARQVVLSGGKARLANMAPKWVPDWVLLKQFFFNRVVTVDLQGTSLEFVSFRSLGHLSHLSSLNLDATNVIDADLAELSELANIQLLNLRFCPITDRGMIHVVEMKNLRWLYVRGTYVSDEGLMLLTQLPHLSLVHARDTMTTDAGRKALRKAMPACRVYPNVQ